MQSFWSITLRALGLILAVVCLNASGAESGKTLRIAFGIAEDGFDPARINDNYSARVTSAIYESLYVYDYLAVPVKIRPQTAVGMPEHSADYKIWTIHIRPGIYFTPDPAFKGKARELVAEDYVYSFKRMADPATNAPFWTDFEDLQIKGLGDLRNEALKGNKPFNYDRTIAGLRAVDRYTLQFQLEAGRPRLVQKLVGGAFRGAVAREVVEAHGGNVMEHPVGTGPFVLRQWRRSSLIVLERNPDYRDVRFEAEPAPDDAIGQAIAARLRGRRIPMVDRVEISIIPEAQAYWLTFLQGKLDEIEVPPEYIKLAVPDGKIAPYLERRGITANVVVSHAVSFHYFNMEDPIVGGYTPEKVALRRAIGLGMDLQRSIRLARGGQGVVAQSPLPMHVSGFDRSFRSENGEYDPARAKALLDLFGYVDRNGDGWREMPDGSPLVLVMASDPSQQTRRFNELLAGDMKAIGVKLQFWTAQWQEIAKAAKAGKVMMWQLGTYVVRPDGLESIERFYSGASGATNLSRFHLKEMDDLYERLSGLPDGEERDALFERAKRLEIVYMPEKTTVHRVFTYLSQPWLVGYRIKPFIPNWYQMVDIDRDSDPARSASLSPSRR